MSTWENMSFGKAGGFYPLLYLVPLPIIGVAIFLLGYSFTDGFRLWERLLIRGGGVFFLIYFVKGVEAIKVSHFTIRKISIKDKKFLVHTFGGKVFEVDRFKKVRENDTLFLKKNIRFLFPSDSKNIVVRCNGNEYYISGNTDRIETLSKAISSK